ncbi:MAG: exosortase K [Kofleriaceae bacterium]
MKLNWYQVGALAATGVMVVAGKQWFRTASVEELGWLLAPTAKCTGVLVRAPFVHETGIGYANHALDFVIAPVCAGLNFLLAAVLALMLGWLPGLQSWTATAKRLASAVALAYVATIIVNTLRITLSIELHAVGELHRLLGIAVYLGGLCAVYAIATKRNVLPAIGAYLAITLALPLIHGAATRTSFSIHAVCVLAICIVVAAIAWIANNRNAQGVPPNPLEGKP